MCSIAILSILVAASACREINSAYCAQNPSDRDCPGDAAGPPCSKDEDCEAPAGVCKFEQGMGACVECTPAKDDACSGSEPICDDDNACRGCEAHAECLDSDACLSGGACANAGDVAYVRPTTLGGTDNAQCTRETPCTKVTSALATGRLYVKITGTNDEGGTVTLDRNVILLADPSAKLDRASDGLHVRVQAAGQDPIQVEINDLEISGASGPQGDGIAMPSGNKATLTLRRVKVLDNQVRGISATGGSLTISQSTFSKNVGGGISATGGSLTISQSTISDNTGGGISMTNGTFVIVGNVFFRNGAQGGNVGGVAISTTQNEMNRLEFNSFSQNLAQSGIGTAIQCAAGAFTARNNIMSDNGTLTNPEQVGGACAHAYSIARPGTVPPGMNNSAMDPLFENSTTGDLHLKAGSPALRGADPASSLTGVAERDIDGDLRTSPADLGADEVP